MAKRLYNSLNSLSATVKPSAPTPLQILEGNRPFANDDALPLQPALLSTILQCNTTGELPSTSLSATNPNAALPGAAVIFDGTIPVVHHSSLYYA